MVTNPLRQDCPHVTFLRYPKYRWQGAKIIVGSIMDYLFKKLHLWRKYAKATTAMIKRERLHILTMAKIFTLANEVLACIFRHLNGLDLGTVAKTCQRFRSATYIDQIWQHICVRGKYLYFSLFWGIKRKVVRFIWIYSNGCSQKLGRSEL